MASTRNRNGRRDGGQTLMEIADGIGVDVREVYHVLSDLLDAGRIRDEIRDRNRCYSPAE